MSKKLKDIINEKYFNFDINNIPEDKPKEIKLSEIKTEPHSQDVTILPVTLIKIRSNIRENIDKESIKELAESIKIVGLLNAIHVYYDNSKYYIIIGHRRFEAIKLLEWDKIPCILKPKPDELTLVYQQIIENEQTKTLTSEEREKYITALHKKYNQSIDEIAKTLGKSKQWIYDNIKASNVREKIEDKYGDKLKKSDINMSTRDLSIISKADDETIDKAVDLMVDNPNQKTNIINAVKISKTKKPKSVNKPKINFEKEFINETQKEAEELPQGEYIPSDIDLTEDNIVETNNTSLPKTINVNMVLCINEKNKTYSSIKVNGSNADNELLSKLKDCILSYYTNKNYKIIID